MRSIYDLPRFAKIGLLILIPVILALFFFIKPEEGGIFPECIFHNLTGYYCPGCGSQRAFHAFLHFDVSGVLRNNILFLPGGAVVTYGILLPVVNRVFHKNYPNILYNKWTPLIIFVIIVMFGIMRNLPYYPFSMLAPG
jgi:hypothetical protein